MMWFHLKRFPGDTDATIHRIWECFYQNQDEEAAKLIQQLGEMPLSDEQRCTVWVYRGWLAYRRGAWEEAERDAQWVLAQCQDNYSIGKAYHLIGACALDRYEHGDDGNEEINSALLNTTLKVCNKALRLLNSHPETLLVYSTLSMAYVYKDDLDHAINLLREAIGNVAQPTREKGWELARLGELYVLDKDDWETGRRYLEQAAEILDPVSQTHAWVHVRLAEGYIGDKEYQKAAVYARKAVELAEKDPRVQAWVHFGAYRAYALALHYGGIDLKEAERQYRRAMKVAEAEDDREAKGQLLAYLGNLYARRKRYRASLRAYNEALRAYGEEAPEIWKLHWSLGSVLSDMGKHQEAADHFRRAVAMLQEMPNALPDDLIDGHMNLGEILYQAKEYAEAEQTFREALRLMPPGDGRRSPAMKWLLAAIQRKE